MIGGRPACGPCGGIPMETVSRKGQAVYLCRGCGCWTKGARAVERRHSPPRKAPA